MREIRASTRYKHRIRKRTNIISNGPIQDETINKKPRGRLSKIVVLHPTTPQVSKAKFAIISNANLTRPPKTHATESKLVFKNYQTRLGI